MYLGNFINQRLGKKETPGNLTFNTKFTYGRNLILPGVSYMKSYDFLKKKSRKRCWRITD